MAVLLLAFIVVPLLELLVIGEVVGWIGLWPTVVVLFVDSLAGAVLVRHEGRRAWRAFRGALGELRWPGDEVTQGALVLVGGALLLTPGFITDVVGLLAVFPVSRAAISRTLRSRVRPGTLNIFSAPSGFGRDAGGGWGAGGDRSDRRSATRGGHRGAGGTREPSVLDVEVVSIEPDEPERDEERGTGED